MPGGYPGDAFLRDIAHELEHRFGIHHSTVQVESATSTCGMRRVLTSDHGRRLRAAASLRYRAEGEPIFVNNCHCRLCQRQTGGTGVVNAFYESDRVELLQGDADRAYRRRAAAAANIRSAAAPSAGRPCSATIRASGGSAPGSGSAVSTIRPCSRRPRWYSPPTGCHGLPCPKASRPSTSTTTRRNCSAPRTSNG